MQKDKKSFVLFLDLKETIDSLSDSQAGKLFKGIFHYQKTGEVNLKGTLKTLFLNIKNTLDRNDQKWEDIKKKRSEAGKKHTGNQYTRQKMEQMEQNGTNGTVSVSENVNVNVSVSEKEKKKEKKDGTKMFLTLPDVATALPPTPSLLDIQSYGLKLGASQEYCEKFYNYYESIGWVNGNGIEIKNWKLVFSNWYKEDVARGKTSNTKTKYDTKTIFTEKETGREFQYDVEGNKCYVEN